MYKQIIICNLATSKNNYIMKLTDLETENILKKLELTIKDNCVYAYYEDEKTTLDVSYDFDSTEYTEGLWLFGDKEELTNEQSNKIVNKMETFYNEEKNNEINSTHIQKEQTDMYLDNLYIVK